MCTNIWYILIAVKEFLLNGKRKCIFNDFLWSFTNS